jgi:hypothetical protein
MQWSIDRRMSTLEDYDYDPLPSQRCLSTVKKPVQVPVENHQKPCATDGGEFQ